MPATFAHYLFGKEGLEVLPKGLQQICTKHRELYDIGVHGPDILFYYQPYKKNPVSSIGFGMHDIKASQFFINARECYALRNNNKEAMIAYLTGFVSHFVLDYTSHSYVEAKIKHSGISHTEIETEYDRHLMLLEKLDPFHTDTVKHINPSKFNADIIHTFFNDIKLKDIHKSLTSMVFYIHLLACKSDFKRNSLYNMMKVTGLYNKLSHQILAKKANALLYDSNLRLSKLKTKALPLFKELAINLLAYLNGQEDLSEKFYYTFSYQKDWDKIPVLSLEKEQEYEI